MRKPATALAVLIALGFASCQSATKPKTRPAVALKPGESELEISYVLGHDSHRIFAHREQDEVTAQSFVNQELLKESKVDPARYEELLTQITGFVRGSHRKPSAASDCRGSFSVTLRQGKDIKTLQGCRSNGDGATFSRITRDAEFLLYSKK